MYRKSCCTSLSIVIGGISISKMLKFYFKVFYVIGKVLSGELSCNTGRSCYSLKATEIYIYKILKKKKKKKKSFPPNFIIIRKFKELKATTIFLFLVLWVLIGRFSLTILHSEQQAVLSAIGLKHGMEWREGEWNGLGGRISTSFH